MNAEQLLAVILSIAEAFFQGMVPTARSTIGLPGEPLFDSRTASRYVPARTTH